MQKTVLVSGATGYIGGRLVPELLEADYRVRCFVRNADRLTGYPWFNQVDVAEGDALDYDCIVPAMENVHAAYYLIHSLGSGEDDFAARDRQAANNFGRAAKTAEVDRIIYLGGIEPKGDKLSKHLKSRLETGRCLRQWDVPVTEFRAAVIVGSGSLSFELIRYLTERVPIMVCPRWVQTKTQPIGVRNVLQYLVQALDVPESTGETIEIGGPDVISYADMFLLYAKIRDLKRVIINVPFLTPRLSSHWIELVTPIDNDIARPLIEGLDNEVTVDNPEKARRLFSVDTMSLEAAMRLAIRRHDEEQVPTVWNTALTTSQAKGTIDELEVTEGLIREVRQLPVDATPAETFAIVKRLGGETGWLYADALWRLRGFLDMLTGGVGFRKGRRHPSDVRPGDAIDFWRVEVVKNTPEAKLLRLRAEMNVHGKAWLQFEVKPNPDAPETNGQPTALLRQTAYFEPKGLFGLLYWYALYVPHRFIFSGMIEAVKDKAEQSTAAEAV